MEVIINESFNRIKLLLSFIELIKSVGYDAVTFSGIEQTQYNDQRSECVRAAENRGWEKIPASKWALGKVRLVEAVDTVWTLDQIIYSGVSYHPVSISHFCVVFV